jgi:peptide/nickel transport system substrate-binding protein
MPNFCAPAAAITTARDAAFKPIFRGGRGEGDVARSPATLSAEGENVTRTRLIGAVLGAFILAAPTVLAAEPQPVSGGTLVFGINAGDPPTYDCHQSVVFAIIHLLTPHYSGLLKIDTAHYPNVVGDAAESWTVSDDAKTYTFRLHPDIKFHDASPLTSEDVKVTYDRIRNPPPGVTSVRQGQVSDIDTIETPDPLTAVFHLKRANRSLVYAFANPFNCLYNAAKLKEDPTFPARHVLGTGPFRFVEHVAGSYWQGERFKDYFKPRLPRLDGFRALFLQGPAIVNALQSGQIMADFRSMSSSDRDRLVHALGDKVTVQESPWLDSLVIVFNSKKKPFDDPRVRRALSLAIDRWKAAEILQRSTILRFPGGFLRPGYALAARDEDLVKMPGFSHDIEASRAEARRLLREAGVPDLKVKLLNRTIANPFLGAGVYIIDQWRQIGVETEHQQVNDTIWNATVNDGTFEAALDIQGDAIDEPDFEWPRYLSADLSSNRGRYIDREIDALFDRQHDAAADPTARYAVLRQFETRMLTEAYIVPLLWWNRIVVMSAKIHGWSMSPSHLIGQDLETVWLEK